MMNFDVESVCILQKMMNNKGDITSCDFSPRFHLASASGDKKVTLYEWKEGLGYVEASFSPLLGHKYSVTCVRFSPTSSILASASVDGHVNLWDIDNGKCIQSLVQAGGNGIRCLEFTRDGTLLASAGEGGTLCIWSITPQMIILIRAINGHDDESIQGISFSPDKQILVSGDVTGTFKIWSLSAIKDEADPPALVTLRDAHDLGVNYLEFSLEFTSHSATDDLVEYEYLLASCGHDHTIALWQISTIQEAKGMNLFLPAQTPALITRLTGHNTAVSQLRISPKGDLLASTSIDKTVRIWQISTGRCLKTLEAHSRYVTSCAFSSDQSLLATGSNDRSIIVWDLTGELSFDSVLDGNTRTSQLFSNAISNSSKENTVMLLHELDKHLSSVNSISFSSLFLVSGGSDHKINIWSWNGSKSMTLLHSIVNAHRYPINQVEMCPKTGILASCSLDGTVLIWDPEDGQIKKSGFHVSGAGVRCVRIAPNGLLLAAGGDDDGLYVYRLDTCECIASAVGDGEGITGLSFTPDSKYLMAGSSDGHSKLYPLVPASSTPVHVLENAHDLGISGIDFAETVHAQSIEDGRYEMATCGQDTLVKVWSLKTNDETVTVNLVWTLSGHGGSVTWVRFSPKLAEMIASTSTDKTCRLWDSYSGDCLHVLDNHQKTLTCCAFSPDATLLATGSMDKSVIIWKLPSDLNFRSFSAKKSAEINLSEWTVEMVNRWLESLNLPPCNFTGNSLLETPVEDILAQLNIDDETRKELFVLQLNELTIKSINEPPHEFLCPITHHIMRDPVTASDGHNYERNAIESWFAAGHSTSPMTNSLMESQDLIPNASLKENIVAFLLGN